MTVSARHLPLAGASNFRDIGGYRTHDGRYVRWGVVYRSGAMYRFTEASWRWLRTRGIRAVCDLRSIEERELAPTDWRGGGDTRHIGVAYGADVLFSTRRGSSEAGMNEMHDSLYPLFPRLIAPSLRAMFEALLHADTPMIVHCSAGQDRTGVAIGILLAALGVPRETVVEDYQLSSQFRRIENELDHDRIATSADSNVFARHYAKVLEKRGAAALGPRVLVNRHGQALLLDAFRAIETEWGSLPAYLETELMLQRGDIERLCETCLAARVEAPPAWHLFDGEA